MQRKDKFTRYRAISNRPSKAALNRSVHEPAHFAPILLISKAPVHRNEPKEMTISDLEADNSLLRRRNTKLLSVAFRQVFVELKTQYDRKQKQIGRMRDMAEFVGAIRPSGPRTVVGGVREPMLAAGSSTPRTENTALRKHLHKLEQAVTELRLELYNTKQEYDQLRDWLARHGLDEFTDHFVPAFDIDAMTYEELLALEERIGYVKVGLSEADIEKIPKVRIGKERAEELCCVCLQPFEVETEAKQLPTCGHLFHPGCIDEWLDKKKTCPLCVTEVQVSSVAEI